MPLSVVRVAATPFDELRCVMLVAVQGREHNVHSGLNGEYFRLLPPSMGHSAYEITVTAPGYDPLVRSLSI